MAEAGREVQALRGVTESELRKSDIPEISYVCGLPLYPVGGSTIIYGPPGIGKSFITQGLNHTLAWGIPSGTFRVRYTANILYCDFEGNASLTQERSLALSPAGSIPSDFEDVAMPTDTTYMFAEHWKGRSFAERLAELEDQLIAKETQGIGYSLVVLDTYSGFVGAKAPTDNAYDFEKAVGELINQLAERHQLHILMIHHPNKAGEMSGSVGKVAAAWISARFSKAGEGQGVLEMEKNRVGPELTLSFDWDRNRIWRLSTDIPPRLALAKGNNRVLLGLLLEHGSLTKRQLMEFSGMPEGSVKSGLTRLRYRGDVEIDGDGWRATFTRAQQVPAMAVHQPFEHCRACGVVLDLDGRGCVNSACSSFEPGRWPEANVCAPRGETATVTERVPAPVTAQSRGGVPAQPRWKQMAQRKAPVVTVPEIDAGHRMDGPQRIWNTSPVSRAVEIIMADRDAGRLGPAWRADLPAEIDVTTDGQHHYGVPVRRHEEYVSQPAGEWVSYDVRGSFLAAYKTPCAVKPLPEPRASDGSDWHKDAAGAVEIFVPDWDPAKGIGHPLGSKVTPGQRVWIWSAHMRLLTDLAAKGEIEAPQVLRTALRDGYQGASQAMFEGFYNQMKAARGHYTGDELVYVKAMYSAWLSTSKEGKSQVFKRPDWFHSIRSEAFARLWRSGWKAVKADAVVLGIGNTDEICFRPSPVLELLFPAADTRIGKLTLKDRGCGFDR